MGEQRGVNWNRTLTIVLLLPSAFFWMIDLSGRDSLGFFSWGTAYQSFVLYVVMASAWASLGLAFFNVASGKEEASKFGDPWHRGISILIILFCGFSVFWASLVYGFLSG